ncbi:cyclopropane-fatty-acyl-phospholipid synthase family protein [Haliscomenobacter sp.]|uniref:SAM-dependent methyltransferase n=1 Tax=Haliscomenobacter sp. TaxID=2717303 RepID=UPI00359305EF
MSLVFGRLQYLTSTRMQASPFIAKLFQSVFGYTNVGNYARSKVFMRIMQQLPIENASKIMDLGCGYGEYSVLMADMLPNAHITALDIDSARCKNVQTMLKKANLQEKIGVVNQKIGDTIEWPQYDFVFSVDVFEHIPEAEMPFSAVLERLRPGGYFLVKIPNRDQRTIFPAQWFEEHQHWLDEEHVGQVYDLEGLQGRFVREGFDIVLAEATDGLLSRLAWELAWLGKKAGVLLQLPTLLLAKLLIGLDPFFQKPGRGNAIHVLGRKPF